jgi:hypothetical protein
VSKDIYRRWIAICASGTGSCYDPATPASAFSCKKEVGEAMQDVFKAGMIKREGAFIAMTRLRTSLDGDLTIVRRAKSLCCLC